MPFSELPNLFYNIFDNFLCPQIPLSQSGCKGKCLFSNYQIYFEINLIFFRHSQIALSQSGCKGRCLFPNYQIYFTIFLGVGCGLENRTTYRAAKVGLSFETAKYFEKYFFIVKKLAQQNVYIRK